MYPFSRTEYCNEYARLIVDRLSSKVHQPGDPPTRADHTQRPIEQRSMYVLEYL